jgi:hypothetical protein
LIRRFAGTGVLLTLALVLLALGVFAPRVRTAAPEPSAPPRNPIVDENRKSGSDEWRIRDITTDDLQGFASRTSVAPRGRIDFYVTSTFDTYAMQIFRMGYYGGDGARLVWAKFGLDGVEQPEPDIDDDTNMVEAGWERSLSLRVPKGWTTGVYLAKLSGPQGQGSYIPFTVREGRERAPILFQSSVTTWQAYNMWGGHSLYFGRGSSGGETTSLRSRVVSFDRPYSYGAGASDFMGLELPVLQWLEAKGYDVSYVTDIDTHQDPLLVSGRKAFLSLGHDEYWSTRMRDHVEDALASGTNLAFFGANAMYRHIRFESSPLGRDRREVNYRSTSDPIVATDLKQATVQWRDYPINRPEDAVLGAMYECNPVKGDAVVYDPLPWLFDGTGLEPDDTVEGIVGDEYDRVFPDETHPERLWVLFRTPVRCGGASSVQDTVFSRFPSGAGVFNAGTSRFVCVFAGCDGAPADLRVQRLVRNLLDAYLDSEPPAREPDPRDFDTSVRDVEPPPQLPSRSSTSSGAVPATPVPPATPPWWRSLPTLPP